MEKTIIYKTNLESTDDSLNPLFYAKMWVQTTSSYDYYAFVLSTYSDWDSDTDEYITTIKTADGSNSLYMSSSNNDTALTDDVFSSEITPGPNYNGYIYTKCKDIPLEIEFYGINHIRRLDFCTEEILGTFGSFYIWCNIMDFCNIYSFGMAANYKGYSPNYLKGFNVANYINWNPNRITYYINTGNIYGTIDANYNSSYSYNLNNTLDAATYINVKYSLHFFNRKWNNILVQSYMATIASDLTYENLDNFKITGDLCIIATNQYGKEISLILLRALALDPTNRILNKCTITLQLSDVDTYSTEIELVRARLVDELNGTLIINGTTY